LEVLRIAESGLIEGRGRSMTLKRLSGLDAAFIAAETPSNHMHMMAVMLLDPTTIPGGYSFEKFKGFIASRLHAVPPLRRRLLEVPLGLARPLWVEDEEINVDLHVRRVAVPRPGGPRELAGMAEDMNGRQLDRDAPLWEMAVVEGLQNGSIALLAKIHHSLMDGMAGMQFMNALVSASPELPDPERASARRGARKEYVPNELELLVGAVPRVVERPLRIAKLSGSSLLSAVREWAVTPDDQTEQLPDAVPVERSIFNEGITPHRSAAYTSLRLEDVRNVARAFDATLNEVVLAVVSGALREYLESVGVPCDSPIVAGVPISTHADEGDELTNAYRVMFTSLATQLTDPVARLKEIRRCSEIEKRRQAGLWGESLSDISDIPSPLFLGLIARAYTGLGLFDRLTPFCNLVVSNVPGPSATMYFGGARIQGVYPLGPVFDGIGLNITVISIDKALNVGLSACRSVVPDLWGIAMSMSSALAELVAASGGDGSERRTAAASD
jgi:WS/DGAT/MGAT family acyltransferase